MKVNSPPFHTRSALPVRRKSNERSFRVPYSIIQRDGTANAIGSNGTRRTEPRSVAFDASQVASIALVEAEVEMAGIDGRAQAA